MIDSIADSHEQQQRTWIVSFADLLSLMLSFMVLLFAMADVDQPQSPTASVDSLSATIDWSGREIPGAAARFSVEREQSIPALDLDYLASVLRQRLDEDLHFAGWSIERRDDQLRLAIPAALLFNAGSAQPTATAQRALAALAPTLSVIGNRLGIEGHTDSRAIPAGAAFASNWELSIARATAVADTLAAAGLRRAITCYGLADTRPDELGDSVQNGGDAAARRVDLVFFASAGDEK